MRFLNGVYKYSLVLLASSAIGYLVACTSQTKVENAAVRGQSASQINKPNVILIFADDISAREFEIYKSSKWSGFRGETVNDPDKLAKTPVLNQIAEQGIYVQNTWAATVCSPSRAMMMTGQYASEHKWWHNKDYGQIKEGNKMRSVRLYETSPLQIGHIAKKAGYKSIWVGKTQMGHSTDHAPYGFDEGVFTPGINYPELSPHTSFGVLAKKINGKRVLYNNDSGDALKEWGYVQQPWYWMPNVQLMNHPNAKSSLEYWPNTKESIKNFGVNSYGPDIELDFIFDFMERQHKANTPFFVYHTTHLGHDAFDYLNPESKDKWPGTPKIKWDGKQYHRTEPNITGSKGNYELNGSVTESGIDTHIEYLDYQIWQYLNKLKEMGIENDTILIFTADNGTSGYGKHVHHKQRGTHVPLVIYAPGAKMTKQGKQPIIASIADIMPTLADITGVNIPNDYPVDGVSLWPYLTTNKNKHRDWIYAYKKDLTLIRGHKVMKDGDDVWWDVSQMPDDLDSFSKIMDWSAVSEAHRSERDKLKSVLPKYDIYHTEHDPVIK
ncbi:sulfatase-like hydrolase/transferase [Catenovulum sediminis]|uniref:Sulfatase-like hydrolase/transferase n=1 Tax=Catenovulum sediminis TaxID=1740262 RepID=A0ABV1RJD2_9ALTE